MSPQLLHEPLVFIALFAVSAWFCILNGATVTLGASSADQRQRLLFVVDRCGMIGSAYMRAIQMNNSRLLQTHYRADVLSERDFFRQYCIDDHRHHHHHHHRLGARDLVVMVKLHHRPSFGRLIKCAQAAGAFAIADVVDDWHSPIPAPVKLDAIIFSNQLHARHELYQAAADPNRRWIVPHHHSNFEHLVHLNEQGILQTIGASSGPAQRMPHHYRRAVKHWAALHSIKFEEHEFVEELHDPASGRRMGVLGSALARLRCDITGTLAPRLNESVYEDNARVHRRINGIDLAIVVADADRDALRYKPNTRMAMFHSHGIPVLSEPYQSYAEQYNSSALTLANMIFSSPAQLVERLEHLRLNPRLLKELGSAALANSRGYELEAIAQQYHAHFQTLN